MPRKSLKKKREEELALQRQVEERAALAWAGYGDTRKPAKAALAQVNDFYEPPYESPLVSGQRAEHPEYDTGKKVERPLVEEKRAA